MKRPEPDDYQFGSIEDLPLFRASVPEGPFSASPAKPTPEELLVGSLIWKHKGRRSPVSLARVRELTRYSERDVKGIVEALIVKHHLRIGAKRDEPFGYYIIQDAADLEAAVKPYKSQIISMLRRLRVLDEPHARREFLGQVRLELEGE